MNEDCPGINAEALHLPRDEVINLIARPDDGTFWYNPRTAKEALKLYATSNELIEVMKVSGSEPSLTLIYEARL